IEVVTQEFFERYCGLFLDVKEALEKIITKNPAISQDFTNKGVDPVDFSKKLLGQIVFLYFLQKKGWFGVGRDDNWGTGPKNFLRLLFEKMIADYKNFFNDILEPLFYEALAKERDKDFYSRFNCKIPFLNGGLFDPISDYDWVHTDILLPDDLFSNHVRTKEGDIGTGILDIFDRYNFTVKEDEPLEKEVAVDPEMLGKVFENLLEVKDRKSKGTYYTPREIVHYMCQESLINYLVNECEDKVNRIDIETLIQYGESAVEHDGRVEQEGKETETYSYKLPESIRKNAQLIDDKLKNIRVCDPAIGSGAFPVGMMNEIIRTRNTLTNYLEDKEDRSMYSFKRNAIQNSLYGVDIDPGAVEIAKLRLWLSLVVDEEDIKQIKPLPNLDYKIMQGNSLLEEFEGVKLFDEELISKPAINDDKYKDEIKEQMGKLQREYIQLHSAGKLTNARKSELELELKKLADSLKRLSKQEKVRSESTSLFDMFSEAKKKAQELKQLHKEFFETSQKTKKDELKKRIENLEWELIETTLKEQNKVSALKQLEQYKKSNIKPFFLWKLHFSEVFQEKGGFDVVIGNPPYSRIQGIDKNFVNIYKKVFKSATNKFDLYVLFVEKGVLLLKIKGILNYIMPHKWINAAYGEGLRQLTSSKLYKFISFRDHQVFNAATYTSLVWLTTESDFTYYIGLDRDLMNNDDLESFLGSIKKDDYSIIPNSILSKENWTFADKKIQQVLEKLSKQKLTVADIFNNVFMGIITGYDKAFYVEGDLKSDYLHLDNGDKIEKEILRPVIKSKGFKRYEPISKQMYIIYPHYLAANSKTKTYSENELKEKYPLAYSHLYKYKEILVKKKIKYGTNENNWFAIHNPREIAYFESTKIITPYLSKESNMSLDENGIYFSDANYGLIKNPNNKIDYKYYLAILNSKLFWFFIQNTGAIFGGGYYYFKSSYLKPFPIPLGENQVLIHRLIKMVNDIINKKSNVLNEGTLTLEKQVDQLVYKLYGLTLEEIAVVEGKND
ncbi:MAG: TaqI-like C-terminal specificity domain-containing protein, partial [Candidatus Woesebacteria bacterium]|nr:TaqI-like C-terminal specificity domain-containing protein [Candidatus Woesebacteria bacterium]